MTIAAARYRCFLRQKQPGAKTGRSGFSAWAVMSVAALAGSLPDLTA
jgi:hypothetical protein